MTGICGWLTTDGGAQVQQDHLSRMGRGLPSLGVRDCVQSRPAGAILCRQLAAEPCCAATDNLLIAFDGHIDFDNAEDAARADRVGTISALTAAYRQHGAEFLQGISGNFALAIVDTERRELLLAADRLGSKPLAFTQIPGYGIVFGTTVDAIRNHASVDDRIDPQAIFNYAYFHVVPSPNTIYKEIQKLKPGEFVFFSGDAAENRTYWRPGFDEFGGESGKMEDRLRVALRNAVAKSIDAGFTTGFLSGGLDSSTIAGLASECQPDKFTVYTMGFEAAGYDEMHYARIAAKHFGLDLREYYVTQQDIVDAMPIIATDFDEPFGNSSAIPTFMCARRARRDGIDKILAGDGGDELFGGNERYAKQKIYEIYSHIPELLRHSIVEPLAGKMPGIFPFGKVRSYVDQARVTMPARLETYNLLNRKAIDTIFEPDFLNLVDTTAPLRLQIERYESAAAEVLVNKMIWLDWKFTLADNDLRKVSRSCEIAGLEVAYPFLDRQLVDLSMRLPANDKVRGRALRHLYKNAFRDFLPDEIINKPKHGFGLPFGVWLATSTMIQEFLYPQIESLMTRGIFRPAFLNGLLEANRSEHAAFYGNFVYVFAMLEMWMEAHAARL